MLLLSIPKYYQRVRFGYVQGHQPVNYVHEVRTRYEAYTRAAGL
jgi:membrane-bound lytic murein transglycosylase F